MRFDILTIFPELINQYAQTSILGRAQDAGYIHVNAVDIREYSADKHKTVDDTPYGGGAGMVMKPQPIVDALASVSSVGNERVHRIVLSPRGRMFTQRVAEEFAEQYDRIVMVSGRYEGIDQRVIDHCVDEEVSIGGYVLAGGELPALVITEAVARLLPGVLGNSESLDQETFGKGEDGGAEYPHYTRPEEFNGWKVPDVLLSGNHAEIAKWRQEQKK